MSDNPEDKRQTCKIRFENDRITELEFWLEPDGMYLGMPPKTLFDVVFTQSESSELTKRIDGYSLITLSISSQAHVYQNNELIYPIWKNIKEDIVNGQ